MLCSCIRECIEVLSMPQNFILHKASFTITSNGFALPHCVRIFGNTMGGDTYHILISLSVLVVVSYIFNILFTIIRVPPVILLLATGALLRIAGDKLGFVLPGMQPLLTLLGVVGLIFIVLEGSLDLNITRDRIPLIFRSLLSALLILLGTTGIITFILLKTADMPLQQAIVYAVPFAVISSAIAIPSVGNLARHKQEFIIYESTFSDILGIMLFNYVSQDAPHSLQAFTGFALDTVIILVISAVSSSVLIFLLDRVRTHIKSFLVFAILVLIYSVSKLFHLPSLLLILIFGLMLNNSRLIIKRRLSRFISLEKIRSVTHELKLLTAESAFLVRTFFFILFGYTMDFHLLLNSEVLLTGLFVILSILAVRFVFLRFISKTHLLPELFIAPRGLITVILFYSIPEHLRSEGVGEGVLLFVVLSSSLIMMLALMFSRREYTNAEGMQG